MTSINHGQVAAAQPGLSLHLPEKETGDRGSVNHPNKLLKSFLLTIKLCLLEN